MAKIPPKIYFRLQTAELGLNNTNGGGGGILISEGVDSEVSNNIIQGNAAVGGGGIALAAYSYPVVVNNTFVGNSGSAIHAYASAAVIVNNIIAFNDRGFYCGNCNITPRYNDVYENRSSGGTLQDYYGVTPGTGCISADPLFVDLQDDDYHLLSGSPCIDTGTSSYGAPANDKDDNPRPYDGDGDTYAYFDMGAYEYQ